MHAPRAVPKDAKTQLQELVQAEGLPVPVYKDIGRKGPDHAPEFEIAVLVKGDAAGVTMFYGAGAGSEQTASAVIADLVDVARLQGTTPAQRVPHQGFHAHAVNEQLAVLPRAAVHTRHYLRVPVHTAQQMEEVSTWLAAQQVPVQRVELARDQALPAGSGPEAQAQVLVLTDAVAQATVDSAMHALADHPAVAGPVVTLRVEWLEG